MSHMTKTPCTYGITISAIEQVFSVSELRQALDAITTRARQDRCAYKNRSGQTGWADGPLNATRINEHLTGQTGCGVGFITPGESTTRLALFDLDSHKGATPFAGMTATADRLCARLMTIGLRPAVFRSSGGAGLHIWLLWDAPQDAYSVRQALQGVLTAEGLTDGAGAGIAGGQVEVFPKQNALTADQNGNMVILPLWNKSEMLIDEFGIGLAPAGRAAVVGVEWPLSDPVPYLVNTAPERVQVEAVAPDSPDRVARALAAIPNVTGGGTNGATDHDDWRNLLFATHHASAGQEWGFDLFDAWTNQNPGNVGQRETRRVWDACKPGLVTRGTLYAMASRCNPAWNAPTPDGFDDLPAEAAWTSTRAAGLTLGLDDVPGREVGTSNPLPAFKRVQATGEIKASKDNVIMGLQRPDLCGFQIRYDSFKAEVLFAPAGTEGWRALRDTDRIQLCLSLERGGFQNISTELIRDAISFVAEQNVCDSAREWLDSKQWDGVPRAGRFLPDYMGTSDTEYTRAVGLFIWSAMAGRVCVPGIKVDMVPVAVGAQGTRKSSAVAALVPSEDFFTTIDLGGQDDDLARKMRGKLIIELDELKGLASRDAEHIKSFITRRYEEWTPKYKEQTVRYARRSICFGTSNQDDFLIDATGNRRWLPFDCGMCDTDAIARDRDQLWAEGRDLFLAGGILHREAERLAMLEHGGFAAHDDWDTAIMRWLSTAEFEGSTPGGRDYLSGGEILREAIGLPIAQQSPAHSARIKRSMVRLGYSYKNMRSGGGRLRVFVAPSLF